MKAAYSVIYSATRSGSNKSYTVVFESDREIDDGNQYNNLIDSVCRHAVQTAQANSLGDVTITAVTLLNPNRDIDIIANEELEQAFVELYEQYVEEDGTKYQDLYNSIKAGTTTDER